MLLGHVPGVACGCEQIRGGVMWPASTSTSDGGGVTGIGGGITGGIGGCLGPVVCTVSARMSGVEFSVGLAVVSINTAQHESLRATCTTLAVGQRRWGTINPPDAPGLVVAGSGWVLSVPRLFLCVGALHPNCRQCTSSVRVHRHVTGAAPRNGCSAPYRVQRPRAFGGCRGCGGLLGLSCLLLGALRGAFVAPHVVVPQKCRTQFPDMYFKR